MGYIQRGQEGCQQEEKNVHTKLKNLAVIWQRNVEEFSTHTGAESTDTLSFCKNTEEEG